MTHELLFVKTPKMKYTLVKYVNMDIDIDTIKQCNGMQRIYKTSKFVFCSQCAQRGLTQRQKEI